MKPSNLDKDGHFSGRINKKVKAILRKLGMTEQKIVDAYIDATLKIDVDVAPIHIKKKKSK